MHCTTDDPALPLSRVCSKSRVCTLPTDIWCSKAGGCQGPKRLPGSEAGVNYEQGWAKPQGCRACCEVTPSRHRAGQETSADRRDGHTKVQGHGRGDFNYMESYNIPTQRQWFFCRALCMCALNAGPFCRRTVRSAVPASKTALVGYDLWEAIEAFSFQTRTVQWEVKTLYVV